MTEPVVHVMAPREGVLPDTGDTHVCTIDDPFCDALREPEIVIYHPAAVLQPGAGEPWLCELCSTRSDGGTDDVFVERSLN